jgi:hypothetical protein
MMNFTVKGQSQSATFKPVSSNKQQTMYLSTNKPYSTRFFPIAVASGQKTVIGMQHLIGK